MAHLNGWLKINSNIMTTKQLFSFLLLLFWNLPPFPFPTLGSHNIPFSDSARTLGFVLDSKLSLKKHIKKICETALVSNAGFSLKMQPRLLFLPIYILSWLDYCNCLFMSTTESVIQTLQKIQNIAARLVLLAPCHHHSTPLLEKMHWLIPSSECNMCKVICMCFSAITGSGPAYLSELLYVYTVSYTTLFFWHPHAENPTIQMQDSWLLHFLLLWTPHWEFTSTRPKTLLNPVIF